MRGIEKAADASGLTYTRMMENAGKSLAHVIISHSHKRQNTILGLIGPGNNGGDTLVALAILANEGWKANAYIVGNRKSDKYLARAKKAGMNLVSGLASVSRKIGSVDVLLDGLLGTGIHLPLRAPFTNALANANEAISQRNHRPLVVAVDCPSGMDCDSGEVAPEALKADLTVTMAAIKSGMLRLPAFEYVGRLEVGKIGLSDDLPEWSAIKRSLIDEPAARAAFPARPLDAHKGTFGTVLIVAGSQRFPGAALLAGEAAYRCGTGLVIIATPETIQSSLAGHLREATWLPLPSQDGWISPAAAEVVRNHLDRVTGLLLGPGLGQGAGTQTFLESVLAGELPPLVIDADALKLLTKLEDWPNRLPAGSVLTPHPGEMAILTGLSTEEIQASRIEIAERFAQLWGHVVVLKGAFTVVAAPDGRMAVLPLATPGLARAGTGDVLAGLIVGLRAQGVVAFDAASAGVWLHGQSGLRAAARAGGSAGLLAGDLIQELPDLIGK